MASSMYKAELGGAIVGGAVTFVVLLVMVISVGGVGEFKALSIIEAVIPSARFLASAAIAAGATVLALLLTLLGLSLTSDVSFEPRLFTRARYITILSVASMVLGVALLLSLTVPLEEIDELARFYDILYYVLAGAISLVGGVLVTVGFMISATLLGLIQLFHPEGHNQLEKNSPDTDRESGAPESGDETH